MFRFFKNVCEVATATAAVHLCYGRTILRAREPLFGAFAGALILMKALIETDFPVRITERELVMGIGIAVGADLFLSNILIESGVNHNVSIHLACAIVFLASLSLYRLFDELEEVFEAPREPRRRAFLDVV